MNRPLNTFYGLSIDVRVAESQLNHRLYMDDLKIYAVSELKLQSLLNALLQFSNDINMTLGLKKGTKLHVCRREATSQLEVDDRDLIQWML